MRMINRTRKEGLGNGFQVVLSFLAARSRRAIAGVRPAQLKEGKPHVLLGSCVFTRIYAGVFCQPDAGLGGQGLVGEAGPGWGRSRVGAESGWEGVWPGAESGGRVWLGGGLAGGGVWVGGGLVRGRVRRGAESGWEEVWLGAGSGWG